MKHSVWMCVWGVCAISSSRGEIIFSQNFSASTSLSSYVNSSQPDPGQWNAITGGAIVNGALSFTRGTSGSSGFTRSTDFSPVPQALIYTFNLDVIRPTTKTAPAAVFQVGAGFSPTLSDAEASTKVNSRFGVNFSDTSGGYTFRNLDTGVNSTATPLSGNYTLTWVINRSGSALQYQAPDGTSQMVGNNQWDLWAWSYPIFDNQPATTTSQPLTDLKFAFNQGSGGISLDNFTIESLPMVPEPGVTGVFAGGLLVLAALATHRAQRKSRPPSFLS